MFDLKKVKFMTYLAIVSILGFGAILVDSVSGVDISGYVNSLLFIIIGIALVIAGGFTLFFSYFKNGLTTREINKIVTIVVGSASVVTGVLIAPFFDFNIVVIEGFKAIISLIAILTIAVEAFGRD